ncbi:MAG: hypothetical protein VKJ06_06850 [Vampirovibrionales bacterium]|nr:hypothetical protein [Vampirovibrionales bacterium]
MTQPRPLPNISEPMFDLATPEPSTASGATAANIAPFTLPGLMAQIDTLPLWVKQVVYAELRSEMERHFVRKTLETFNKDNLLPLYVPSLTPHGLKNVSSPDPGLSLPMHRLLCLSQQKTTVVNMCITEQWSLAECSKLILEALKQTLLNVPASPIVYATIEYLSGTIRLGNYMVKIGRITVHQLDEALRTQHYISEAMGEKTGIANVLINLGYITKEDAEGILFLKSESQKRLT